MPIATPFRFRTLLLALVTAGVVALAAINFGQRSKFSLPTDGVSWVETGGGLSAWIVDKGGAGERAGIESGDTLEAINGHTVRTTTEAEEEVYNSGIWSKAAYDLVRQGQKIRTEVVLSPQSSSGPLRDYLNILGLCFLAIG